MQLIAAMVGAAGEEAAEDEGPLAGLAAGDLHALMQERTSSHLLEVSMRSVPSLGNRVTFIRLTAIGRPVEQHWTAPCRDEQHCSRSAAATSRGNLHCLQNICTFCR